MNIIQIIQIFKQHQVKFIFICNENILYYNENGNIKYTSNMNKTLVDHFLELFNFNKNFKKNIYYEEKLYTKENKITDYSLILDDKIIIGVKNAGFHMIK